MSTKAGVVGISAGAGGLLADSHGVAGVPVHEEPVQLTLVRFQPQPAIFGNKLSKPGEQSLLLRRRQQSYFFLNLFQSMHDEIKLQVASFGKSMLAPGEQRAGDLHLVADFERADGGFGNGSGEFGHGKIQLTWVESNWVWQSVHPIMLCVKTL